MEEKVAVALTPLECVQQLNASLQGAIRCVAAAASAGYHPETELAFAEGDVDHHVAKFLDNAKGLEDFFSEVRDKEMQKSEVALRKEIALLEKELEEKDACIEKYLDKAKQWEESFRILLEEHHAFEGREREGTPLFLPTEDTVMEVVIPEGSEVVAMDTLDAVGL